MNTLEWMSSFKTELDQTQCKIKNQVTTCKDAFQISQKLILDVKQNKGTVWWVANGGSSTIGAHLSQDLINKQKIRSHAFTNFSLITCMANDFGYEAVYRRPLETMAQPGDLLIAISSSGNSKNILESVRCAKEKKVKVIALSSMKPDNALWSAEVDINFYLPTMSYGVAEVGHLALLHAIIETL